MSATRGVAAHRACRGRAPGGNGGFTFIETLVVTVMLGIVLALAVPSFGVVRRTFFNGTAKSDLANVRTALSGAQPTMKTGTTVVNGPAAVTGVPGARVSRGVRMTFSVSTSNTTVKTNHNRGSVTYTLDNNRGKITP